MALSFAAVVLLLLLLLSPACAQLPGANTTDAAIDLIRAIYNKTVDMENELLDFWLQFGPDGPIDKPGSFYGEIDENGVGKENSNKYLQQQARHLWTFSTAYAMRAERRTDEMSADGNPVSPAKKVYENAFAIYGLSAFAMAFKLRFSDLAEQAETLAMAVYRTLRTEFAEPTHGGYKDTMCGRCKGLDTHLHLLEAFAQLYVLTGDADVLASVDELYAIHLDHILAGEYCIEYMNDDWTPASSNTYGVYGHCFEVSCLLLDSARLIHREYEGLREALLKVGEYHSKEAYDAERGGFYNTFVIANPAQKDTTKIWWVQAEALPGLWNMYVETGDVEHLRRLLGMVEYIEKYQRVSETVGEWWEETDETGKVVLDKKRLSHEWKSSYHTSRALLFLNYWISKTGVVDLSHPSQRVS
ncbi:unnamed protein product [Vitrella brassicaformis CCMP3155]|uniref:N-acylglucosamine 2-epimerase n=1 Tax=Vitrella brassicaformis (strain CCMP3155) TaxID=1169540 RepID=A0A0G4EZ72_VITBC|nr:unnamed protein product [Vitrella brassicaformis CCMP3155]|eukprot:CEM04072.1 unnamed protein product [Vitrella brassicaformis CCMP3155]